MGTAPDRQVEREWGRQTLAGPGRPGPIGVQKTANSSTSAPRDLQTLQMDASEERQSLLSDGLI